MKADENVTSFDYAHLDRRQVIGSTLLLAGLIGVPLWIAADRRTLADGKALPAERKLLTIVSDLTIPGAVAADVPAFVEVALAHGLEGTRDPGAGSAIVGANVQPQPRGGLFLLGQLRDHLDLRARGDFTGASRAIQAGALAAIDAAAFAPGAEDHVWHKIKNLILLGYYTSMAGGSVELAYELVPGRFDPAVPLARQPRAYSSDWTAVDFG